MASDSDKTMSEAQPRRPRRRPAAAATPTASADRARRPRRGAAEQEASEETTLAAGKGRATPSRRAVEEAEEKAGNVVTRTIGGLRGYFEGVGSELRKVTWPSQDDLRRLSIIVIVTLVAAALALGLISFAFTELFRLGLSSPIILIGFMAVAVVVGFVVTRAYGRRTSA
ncbi:MAG: preprotein translocase subunit SecE [Anaerolineae bacterium]|nr:preprotein translocase subunit SecE [Anaerolineae bacterium]